MVRISQYIEQEKELSEIIDSILVFEDTFSGMPAASNLVVPLCSGGLYCYDVPASHPTAMMFPDEEGFSYPVSSNMPVDVVAKRVFHPLRIFVVIEDLMEGSHGFMESSFAIAAKTILALRKSPKGRDCVLVLTTEQWNETTRNICSALKMPVIYDESSPGSITDPVLRLFYEQRHCSSDDVRKKLFKVKSSLSELHAATCEFSRYQALRSMWIRFFRGIDTELRRNATYTGELFLSPSILPSFSEELACLLVNKLSFGYLLIDDEHEPAQVRGWDNYDRWKFMADQTELLDMTTEFPDKGQIAAFTSLSPLWINCLAAHHQTFVEATSLILSDAENEQQEGIAMLEKLGDDGGIPKFFESFAAGVPIDDIVA